MTPLCLSLPTSTTSRDRPQNCASTCSASPGILLVRAPRPNTCSLLLSPLSLRPPSQAPPSQRPCGRPPCWSPPHLRAPLRAARRGRGLRALRAALSGRRRRACLAACGTARSSRCCRAECKRSPRWVQLPPPPHPGRPTQRTRPPPSSPPPPLWGVVRAAPAPAVPWGRTAPHSLALWRGWRRRARPATPRATRASPGAVAGITARWAWAACLTACSRWTRTRCCAPSRPTARARRRCCCAAPCPRWARFPPRRSGGR